MSLFAHSTNVPSQGLVNSPSQGAFGQHPLFPSVGSLQGSNGGFGTAPTLPAQSLFSAAPTSKDKENMVKSMPRAHVINELQRLKKPQEFYTLSQRIEHEVYIARLKTRLLDLGSDERIDEIMQEITECDVGKRSSAFMLTEIKTKMLQLSPDDLSDLYYVFEKTEIQTIVDILYATYPGHPPLGSFPSSFGRQ